MSHLQVTGLGEQEFTALAGSSLAQPAPFGGKSDSKSLWHAQFYTCNG
jgi:hypothetical protein